MATLWRNDRLSRKQCKSSTIPPSPSRIIQRSWDPEHERENLQPQLGSDATIIDPSLNPQISRNRPRAPDRRHPETRPWKTGTSLMSTEPEPTLATLPRRPASGCLAVWSPYLLPCPLPRLISAARAPVSRSRSPSRPSHPLFAPKTFTRALFWRVAFHIGATHAEDYCFFSWTGPSLYLTPPFLRLGASLGSCLPMMMMRRKHGPTWHGPVRL